MNSNHYFIKTIFCISLVLKSFAIEAHQIISTFSIESSTMKKLLDEVVDQKTIVFIDIDDVIFTPTSQIFHHRSIDRNILYDVIGLSKKDIRYEKVAIELYTKRQVKIVEPGWKNFIDALSKKGAKIYAYFSPILNVQGIYKQKMMDLISNEIHLSRKFNDKSIAKIRGKENPAFFYYGLISTGGYEVSSTIFDLVKLDKLDHYKIMVLSYKKKDLHDIYEKLRVFNKNFYLVNYLGITNIVYTEQPKITELQKKFLFNKMKWLEDPAAKYELTLIDNE